MGRFVCCLVIALIWSCSVCLGQAENDPVPSGATQSQRDNSRDSARETEMSSSKDTRIDLSPPKDDSKNHPNSVVITDEDETPSDVDEMHPWDPHKAAKD